MNDYLIALEAHNHRAEMERVAARERLVKLARADDAKEASVSLVNQHLLGWGQESQSPAPRRALRSTSEVACATC